MGDGDPDNRDVTRARAEFTAFVMEHRLGLVRTAAGVLGRPGPDAEDLVQTALERLAPMWSQVENPLPYTRKVLMRLAVDASRRRKRRPEVLGLHEDHVEDFPFAVVQDGTARIDLAADLWTALAELSVRQRQVLSLRYLCDCTETETAQVLGCAVGTVKSEAHRGIKRLRAAFIASELDPTGPEATHAERS